MKILKRKKRTNTVFISVYPLSLPQTGIEPYFGFMNPYGKEVSGDSDRMRIHGAYKFYEYIYHMKHTKMNQSFSL
jgi:hypothetical protein